MPVSFFYYDEPPATRLQQQEADRVGRNGEAGPVAMCAGTTNGKQE